MSTISPDRAERSYCVGLPVVITIHADGSVTYKVDLSEAADLSEGAPTDDFGVQYTDEQIDIDIAAVSAAIDAKTIQEAR